MRSASCGSFPSGGCAQIERSSCADSAGRPRRAHDAREQRCARVAFDPIARQCVRVGQRGGCDSPGLRGRGVIESPMRARGARLARS